MLIFPEVPGGTGGSKVLSSFLSSQGEEAAWGSRGPEEGPGLRSKSKLKTCTEERKEYSNSSHICNPQKKCSPASTGASLACLFIGFVPLMG